MLMGWFSYCPPHQKPLMCVCVGVCCLGLCGIDRTQNENLLISRNKISLMSEQHTGAEKKKISPHIVQNFLYCEKHTNTHTFTKTMKLVIDSGRQCILSTFSS